MGSQPPNPDANEAEINKIKTAIKSAIKALEAEERVRDRLEDACMFMMSGGQCAGCLAEGAHPSSQRFFLTRGHLWPRALAQIVEFPNPFELLAAIRKSEMMNV